MDAIEECTKLSRETCVDRLPEIQAFVESHIRECFIERMFLANPIPEQPRALWCAELLIYPDDLREWILEQMMAAHEDKYRLIEEFATARDLAEDALDEAFLFTNLSDVTERMINADIQESIRLESEGRPRFTEALEVFSEIHKLNGTRTRDCEFVADLYDLIAAGGDDDAVRAVHRCLPGGGEAKHSVEEIAKLIRH